MDPSHIASEFARAVDEWHESDPDTYFSDEERYGERPDEIDPQIGFVHE